MQCAGRTKSEPPARFGHNCLPAGRLRPSSQTRSASWACLPPTAHRSPLLSSTAQHSQSASEESEQQDRNESWPRQLPASPEHIPKGKKKGPLLQASPLSFVSPSVQGFPAAADSKHQAPKESGEVLPRDSAGTFRSSSNSRSKTPHLAS